VWGFFGRMSQQKQLQALEREADAHPRDAEKQVELLRVLNTLDPDSVVRRCDSRQFATSEGVAKEYIKALVQLGRLDRTRLQDLNRIAGAPIGAGTQGGAVRHAEHLQAASGNTWGAGHLMRVPNSGSNQDPIRISMLEPSMQQQAWKTLRALATAYLLLLGISTIMEERGLSRSGGTSQSVTQATESTKTFSDVVGVDEAKAELQEIVEFLRNPDKFTRLGGKMTKGICPGSPRVLSEHPFPAVHCRVALLLICRSVL
jgi:ATP-dependent metalloprotease